MQNLRMTNIKYVNMLAVAALCLFAGACAKKQVAVAPPPPPAPVAAPAPAPPAATPVPARPQTAPQQVARSTPSNYPNAATRARIDELIGRIQDAYFDYNEHTLRADAVSTLNADSKELAVIMQQFPDYKLQIEG